MKKRSLGGVAAKRNDYPWIVSLITSISSTDFLPHTVSLQCDIDRQAIACKEMSAVIEFIAQYQDAQHDLYKPLDEAKVVMYVGGHCRFPSKCSYESASYRIVNMEIHPNYDSCNLYRDIAIAEISENVHSDGVPICMPDVDEEIPSHLVAVGYGFNPNDKYRRLLHAVDLAFYKLDSYHDQLHTLTSGKSICRGDSGGPLIKTNGTRYTLIGITSSNGQTCEGPEVPQGYLYVVFLTIGRLNTFEDVRKYLDWICEITGVCPSPSSVSNATYEIESSEVE
ncbi:trypsin [Dictyocaulus viviparus]|uniref:Trypsin n=1 Tax=Dictyocaulus viviparus TaxID=29172 RepID=A0A0D8Y6N9_DICVI|nr:trypsin [Dictyocaulus viviparus]